MNPARHAQPFRRPIILITSLRADVTARWVEHVYTLIAAALLGAGIAWGCFAVTDLAAEILAGLDKTVRASR